ncbi:MAG: hypothetical protein NT169_26730 [Chloroflexi bacterium]|nr:hypothetical protein [Chloroflexota bacterium]
MNPVATSSRTHLFTGHLWLEEFADGGNEWRGKVQHVLSGETRYFQDWHVLLAFLQETSQRSATIASFENLKPHSQAIEPE